MTAVLQDIWSGTLDKIRESVGPRRFYLWFRETELLSTESGVFHIGVPSRFVAEWLSEHLTEAVHKALSETVDACESVQFVVSPKLFRKVRTAQIEAQQELLEEVTHTKPARNTNDGQDYSLTSFVVGHCNRLAYAAAKHVADTVESQLNPLFVHGAVGLGKTHLLRGICASVNATGNRRAFYIPSESFTNQFVASLQHHSLDAFRARFRNVDMLAIDDVHFLADKKATQQEFLHTYDFLRRLGKQVVMASDAHPHTIKCVMDSLSNRIASGMIIRLEEPGYETRVAILHRKLSSHGHVLSEDVLNFVAENIQGNVRELQGAATTLLATGRLLGRKVDIETAREALQPLICARNRRVTLADVEHEVCLTFGVSPEELLSKRRTRSITTPRHVAMYLSRELTEHSWHEIGTYFKRRNHSAAIFAYKKISQRVHDDPPFQDRVRSMISELQGRHI